VLGVDERRDAAGLLGVGDDGERERGLTRGLRAEDLDDPAPRDAATAQREVEREGTGRDAGIARYASSSRRMIEPLPKDFSICPRARSRACALP
jgi:hypothetical protein